MTLVRALCLSLVLLQLGFSWTLFGLRFFEQGKPFVPEFALKEEALILGGHLLAYFLVLFVPAHILFFFRKSERTFQVVFLGVLIASLAPFLSFCFSYLELGVWYVGLKAIGFLIFSGIWFWLSYRAFSVLIGYYSTLLKSQK